MSLSEKSLIHTPSQQRRKRKRLGKSKGEGDGGVLKPFADAVAEKLAKQPLVNGELLEPHQQGKRKRECTTIPRARPGFIPLSELETKKMSVEALANLGKFKNHEYGAPSNILYIKNLARATDLDDLEYVFGAFVTEEEEKEGVSSPPIQHMSTGRMRGQAFVTFASMEAATIALESCHGHLLNGKPMIVSYGKRGERGQEPDAEAVAGKEESHKEGEEPRTNQREGIT